MDTYEAYGYTGEASAWTSTKYLYNSVGTYRGIVVKSDDVARSKGRYSSGIGPGGSERWARSHTREVRTNDVYST